MKRIFTLITLLSIGFVAFSQPKNPSDYDCYTSPRKKGIEALNKKKYDEAEKFLLTAKACPTQPKHNDIDKLLNKVKEGKRSGASPTTKNPRTPNPVAVEQNTAKYKINAINTKERTGCYQGRQGIEVTADFFAENLKGQTIYAECQIVPVEDENITEKYKNTQFDIDGKAGLRGRKLFVEEGYQHFTDVFFIPYGAMRIQDYEDQSFEITLKVYREGTTKEPIENGTLTHYVSTEPVSLYVDNDIKDKHVSIKSYGGSQDFDISVCGNIQWKNVPSWIKAQQATIFVDKNESTTPREAVLTISPQDGGNSVNVYVSQDGAREVTRVSKPLAEINNVQIEHNVRGADGKPKMVFHVNLNIRQQKGKRIQVYALFYNADDETRLLDEDGNWVTCHGSGTPSGDDVVYEDFHFYLDNSKIFKASNLQEHEVNAYVMVTFDGGQSWEAQRGPFTISW